MTATGVHLLVLLGPTVPRPAPASLLASLERVEITQPDDGPGAFQLLFTAGRGGPGGRLDHPVVSTPLLDPFARVVLVAQVGARVHVLIDGVVTQRQLTIGERAGEAVMAVTGEDLTVLMGLEERIEAHPALSEAAIAALLIARYAHLGIVPRIIPPAVVDQPLPIERVPVQHDTDLGYLEALAARFNHVFTLRPGPMPLTSVAFWGPAALVNPLPLPALTVAMGGATNVDAIEFRVDALAPKRVQADARDPLSGRTLPVLAFPTPTPLARRPLIPRRSSVLTTTSGQPPATVRAVAQSMADASAEQAVTAEGELATARYGTLLEPWRVVGVRGAGDAHDGLYRVRSVSHVLERGQFLQRFRLARSGTGTTTPVLPTAVAGMRP